MTTTEFLQEVNDKFRGEDDDAPTAGTDEFAYWMRTANRIRRKKNKVVSKRWRSTWSVAELGTITAAAAPAFDLEDTFLGASDSCYAVDADGHRTDFTIVQPQDHTPDKLEVYIAGIDPQILYFSQEITSTSSLVGATLYLPGYFLPDDISTTSGSETVIDDDVDWLATATAAELAANSITYEDKAPDLNAEANELYKQMANNNTRGTAGNPRTSRMLPKNRIGQRHS